MCLDWMLVRGISLLVAQLFVIAIENILRGGDLTRGRMHMQTFGMFRREKISAVSFLDGCLDRPKASCGTPSTAARI